MSSPAPAPLLVHGRFLLLLLVSVLGLAAAPAPAWDPIDPRDLASRGNPQYPNTPAEILLYRETYGDKDWTTERRIKLYHAAPEIVNGLLRITFPDTQRIADLAARVVKPDGSSTEYTAASFVEGVALKNEDGRVRQLSAALPTLGDGDIVDIRWRRRDYGAFNNIIHSFQDTVPIREFVLELDIHHHEFNAALINVKEQTTTKLSRLARRLVAKNLPPVEREPLAPSRMDTEAYYVVLYAPPYYLYGKTEDCWTSLSTGTHERFLQMSRPNAEMKARAAELVAGPGSEEAKLARLHEFCRTTLTNLSYKKTAELVKRREKRDRDFSWDCRDTLSKKLGYTDDITCLFGALAKTAGFETRLCRGASRKVTLDVTQGTGYFFMENLFVAVKVGKEWKFYAPGEMFVPAGMLPSDYEYVPYLRCEEKGREMNTTPAAPASATEVVRKARLTLDPDGTLEGEIEITSTGHAAIEEKEAAWYSTQEEVDTRYREAMSSRLPTAEITGLAWTHLGDTAFPLVTRHHIRIPGYAEQLGDTLVLAPNLFERGGAPLFTAPTRTHKIVFPYAKTVLDDIEIVLPEGYRLDAQTAPGTIDAGVPVLQSVYSVSFRKSTRTLSYQRRFTQCGDAKLTYLAKSYEGLKHLAELLHRSDNHSFLCKPIAARKDAAAESKPTEAARTP